MDEIKTIEDQIEKALWSLEQAGEIEGALAAYREAEEKLGALGIATDDSAYPEGQRVLAYCLMRQGNILRQQGKAEEALALGEREIAAARASGDKITLARTLMSNGTNRIVSGETDSGLALADQARELFEAGESHDHRQGLGWYWILQADLANAGLIEREPAHVLGFAGRALAILEPIENWPGVARAYAARAAAHERMGHEREAARDRKEQQHYEGRVEPEEEAG